MQTYTQLFNSYTPEKQAQIKAAVEALKAKAAAAQQPKG